MKGIKKIDENVISPYRSLTITNPDLIDNQNWQVGTLKCDPINQGLTYKADANGVYSFFKADKILAYKSITGGKPLPDGTTSVDLIGDEEIQTAHLADESVTSLKIKNRTIQAVDIQAYAITQEELSSGCVTDRVLADNSIYERHITDSAVTENKIKNASVTYDKMANLSVGTPHLCDNAVTEIKIATDAVTASKIANASITYQKIKPYNIIGGEMTEIVDDNGQKTMVQGHIAQATITGFNLANYAINSQHIMDGAILNRCIGDKEVYGDKIAPKAITFSHIADKTITGAQIASNTLTADNYADRSISVAKVDNEIASVINNAIIYDTNGNVNIKSNADVCNVKIGSEDAFGKSMGDGSLRVYGDIRADRVYNMAYSDLAEGYIPGEHLEPGDIVEIRENGKVYKSFTNGINAAIVGVVSDEYAACYGATKEEILRGKKVAVALVGKVHVKVAGPIKIGDAIKVNNIPGVGSTWSLTNHTIGTALETVEDEGVHKILCLVRPN